MTQRILANVPGKHAVSETKTIKQMNELNEVPCLPLLCAVKCYNCGVLVDLDFYIIVETKDGNQYLYEDIFTELPQWDGYREIEMPVCPECGAAH